MISIINESAVLKAFNFYLRGTNIGQAFDQLIDDAINEDLDSDDISGVIGFIVPEVVKLFAAKYEAMDEAYELSDDDGLNSIFDTFCQINHIDEDLRDAIALAINAAAANDDDEGDDNDAVFIPDDWDELTDDERQVKVKAFLKKIAHAHRDARDMKPFLKNLNIGDQPDPYGNKFGEKVKTFDDPRFGHSDESVELSRLFHHSHEAADHPLAKICRKHGYQHFETTPVTNSNGSVQNYHVWQHPT